MQGMKQFVYTYDMRFSAIQFFPCLQQKNDSQSL